MVANPLLTKDFPSIGPFRERVAIAALTVDGANLRPLFVRRTFRAPGRVNLIGEHTDYNGGFVLPVAIQMATWVTVAAREDRRVVASSSAVAEPELRIAEFDLDDVNAIRRGQWSDYVQGVAMEMERAGHRLSGADLEIWSDVPIGAGLSSSAALEVSTAMALLANCGFSMSRVEVAKLCQRAENEFVGARCGIMDQFTSCCARAGHALLLDCRSLEATHVSIPDSVKLVVCNTMVRHELASNEYNLRREQCEAAAKALGVESLRDATEASGLQGILRQRARHVITENQRVLDACDALRAGDMRKFGELMVESHRSLRDDYEVSCAELDLMVKLALKMDGVYGARMTGGGFGGCTINLVDAGRAQQFGEEIADAYSRETSVTPAVYICEASGGASEETL